MLHAIPEERCEGASAGYGERGRAGDHPEVLTIPETGFLKGVLLAAMDR